MNIAPVCDLLKQLCLLLKPYNLEKDISVLMSHKKCCIHTSKHLFWIQYVTEACKCVFLVAFQQHPQSVVRRPFNRRMCIHLCACIRKHAGNTQQPELTLSQMEVSPSFTWFQLVEQYNIFLYHMYNTEEILQIMDIITYYPVSPAFL